MKRLIPLCVLLLTACAGDPTSTPTASPTEQEPSATVALTETPNPTPTPTLTPTRTPRPTPGPGLDDLLATPQAHYTEAQLEEARAAYEAIAELYPNSAAPYLGLATIAQREGEEDEALDYLEDAVEAEPTSTEALRRLAVLLDKRAAYDDLVEVYGLLLEQEPNDPGVYVARAIAAARLGEADTAIDDLAEAQALDPFLEFAWSNASAAARSARHYEQALAIAEAGVESNPESADLYVARGLASMALLDAEAALGDFEQAVSLNDGLTAAHLWRGRALLELDRPEDAFEAFDRAATLGTLSAVTGQELGFQAVADAAEALARTDPDAAFAYLAERVFDYGSQDALLLGYARVDLERGSASLALNRLNGLVLNGYTPALYWRAVARVAEDQPEEAIADLEAYLEAEPAGYFAEKARALLADLD